METYQIVFLTVAATLGVFYLVDRIAGLGILENVIQWRPMIVAMTALVKAASAVLPSEYFKTVVVVLEASSDGAQKAEELWKLGKLPKEERNAYAQTQIAGTLHESGIEVTEQVQQIIDGCIAIICMLMPHTKKVE